jgi:hypothetical protein
MQQYFWMPKSIHIDLFEEQFWANWRFISTTFFSLSAKHIKKS